MSSQNPNEQNISKQEDVNLRQIFGPAQGRVWFSNDAKNIELRIPAYEAGEEDMIRIFEHPDEPPYYGSYHMLIFAILHPKFFAKYGMECKKRFASTWYQWTKNGNFAVQYGAHVISGTADSAYHIAGAQQRIMDRFPEISKLNTHYVNMGNKTGVVHTLPDKTVDPKKGYPIVCTKDKWGKIRSTVPLNYHVQGTAMWWMSKAMVKCHNQLEIWNKKCGIKDHYRMVMQVHDELVFDLPNDSTSVSKAKKLAKIMESCGDDIGIPTPVGVEIHKDNWAEGEVLV
jgi:DNA polymerase-1